MSTINSSFQLTDAYKQQLFNNAMQSAHAPQFAGAADSVKFSAVQSLKFGEDKSSEENNTTNDGVVTQAKGFFQKLLNPVSIVAALAGGGLALASMLGALPTGGIALLALPVAGALLIGALAYPLLFKRGDEAETANGGENGGDVKPGGTGTTLTQLKNFPIYAGFVDKTEALIDKKKQKAGTKITIRNLKWAIIEAAGLDPFDKSVVQKLDEIIKAKKLGDDEVGSMLIHSQPTSGSVAASDNARLISVDDAKHFVQDLFKTPNTYLATNDISTNAKAAVNAYVENLKAENKGTSDYEPVVPFDKLVNILLTGKPDGTPSATERDVFLHKVIAEDAPSIAAYNPKSSAAKDSTDIARLKESVPESDRDAIIEAWATYCAAHPIQEPVSTVPAVLVLSKLDQADATLGDKLADLAHSNSSTTVLSADTVTAAFNITDSTLRSKLTTALNAALKAEKDAAVREAGSDATKKKAAEKVASGYTSVDAAMAAAKKALADVTYEVLEDKVSKAFNQVQTDEKRGYILVNALAPNGLGQKIAVGHGIDPELNENNWHEPMTLDQAKLGLAHYIEAATGNRPAKAPAKTESSDSGKA